MKRVMRKAWSWFVASDGDEPMKGFVRSNANFPEGHKVCPETGRVLRPARKGNWLAAYSRDGNSARLDAEDADRTRHDPRLFTRLAWGFSAMGLVSLLWFLVRVIPKPSRAFYPCQRAAFPVASGFVVWVAALAGSAFAWRKSLRRDARVWQVCLWSAAALALAALVVTSLPTLRAWADNPPHGVLGVAKGIFPGRVVWVHAPQATSWAGYTSSEHWFETNHTDLAVVEEMMSKAVRKVGGGDSDAAAWDAIFKYFNLNHHGTNRGYQAGENIAIKINLTTCNGRTNCVEVSTTYEKRDTYRDGHWLNTIDNSPQMLLSLLRHLVYAAKVDQTNIYLGDPTANFPKYLWDKLHPEFSDVHYFDSFGGQGRMRTELATNVPFNWSASTVGKLQDKVPVPFAQADYLINFAILKGHSTGVTVCGKNWYGALLRCPDGAYRDTYGSNQWGMANYTNIHRSTPNPNVGGAPGLGHYRGIVDLMGHPALGEKTLLCLVDGLFGGYFADSHPYQWNMAPFNTNWPSSLFVSQDPVAIDSVCYDFLLREWPNVVNNGSTNAGNLLQGGAEDYLHEAAQANNPASGTFYDPARTGVRLASLGVHEHWNNSTNKQYSRNLSPTGQGIELVALTATRPDPVLAVSQAGSQAVVSWQGSLTGFRLQSATHLATTNSWLDVGGSPVLVQGRNTVTNELSGARRFYRLIK